MNLLAFIQAFAGIAILEILVGLATGNVHVLKDFLVAALLLLALYASHEAQVRETQDSCKQYSFGKRRLTLLSAMGNCIYLQCLELFNFLEAVHHIIEHFELASHNQMVPAQNEHGAHDDAAHQAQSRLWISIFATLRILLCAFYIYSVKPLGVLCAYWEDNWAERKVETEEAGAELRKGDDAECGLTHDSLKEDLRRSERWTSSLMNLVSVHLILLCYSLDQVAKLWTNFLCMNFG